MTRDVRIQKSGVSQDFSDVKTVTTPVVGGGNATWMPEDETAVGEITITGNGEYVPSEHDLYGFYKVNVMVPGGGQGEYVEPGGIGVNVDGTIPMTQPNGTISNVRIGDGPYIPPPAGMGGTIDGVSVSGGTIAGIDPDTGDYVQYTVVDSNGVPTLSKTTPQSEPRPASIRIINPPNKTTYEPGGLILFSGLTVGVYDQNGNPFTSPSFLQENHTYGPYDGTVPFHELHFPVKYAPYEQSETDSYTYPSVDTSPYNQPIPSNTTVEMYSWEGRTNGMGTTTVTAGEGTLLIVESPWPEDGWTEVYAVSKNQNMSFMITTYYHKTGETVEPEPKGHSGTGMRHFSYDNKDVYFQSVATSRLSNALDSSGEASWINASVMTPKRGAMFPSDINASAWVVMHGQLIQGGVPIEWISPYDGNTYSCTLSLEVKETASEYSGSGGGSF